MFSPLFPEIIAIDCNYINPEFAAAYLVYDSGRAFFVDNNTAHSVPRLLETLSQVGLTPEQVDYIIITHVHLDHAGGSSMLMKACPNAQLLGHPRATPHVIDPSRLVSSAQAVYGKNAFESLYGTIEAIAADRVRAVQDEEVLSFGKLTLRFFFTRGHANHHMCVQLSKGGKSVIFTGDAFGLAYPMLQKAGLFIFPSTSPTDFIADEARKSVRKILNCGAQQVLLTHFSGVNDLKGAAEQLIRGIDFSEKVLEEAQVSGLPDDQLTSICQKKLNADMETQLNKRGMSLSGDVAKLLKLDLELNAAGIAYVAKKTRTL